MINIPSDTLNQVIKVISSFPNIKEAYLYGSRARGDHKLTSDIDIAILPDNVDPSLPRDVYAKLEEEVVTALKFDILDIHTTNNPSLLSNIHRDKVLIYSKT